MSAVALGSVAVGGVVLGEHADPAVSAPSAKQDAEILNFALLLEFVQSAFYIEGLSRAGLTEFTARRLAVNKRIHKMQNRAPPQSPSQSQRL